MIRLASRMISDPSAEGLTAAVLEVRAIDPLADPEWDHWVSGHPEATPFHRAAWARVLVRTYGHRPRYLAFLRHRRPVALLPLMEVNSRLTGCRAVCVPFADVCAPLIFESLDPRLLLDVVLRLAVAHSWRHVELRGPAGLPADAVPSVAFCAHELDMSPGPDRLLAGFDPAVRRALRKAERQGVVTEVRTDAEAVAVFLRLHAQTRRRHGAPPQPDRFFDAIREEILAPGHGAVVLAWLGGAPVAAAVFFHSEGRAVYKFGASDERAQSSRANNLAMWRGLQWLASRGATSLHFGRTSCSQDGLRRFKRAWGAIESSLSYFKLQPPGLLWGHERDRGAGWHTSVFSRLPLPVNRLLGTALYPHLD